MTATQFQRIENGTVGIHRCMLLLSELGKRERRTSESLAGRPWWRAPEAWIDHRDAAAERRKLSRQVSDQRWDQIALTVIVGDMERLRRRRDDPAGNLFHPRVLDILGEVVEIVIEGPERDELTAEAIEYTPELSARFTPSGVKRLVRAEVKRRQEVASSPLMLSAQTPDGLVVQHQASGLRARFKRDKGGTAKGSVFSKPYKIPTLDWTDTTPEDEIGDEWEDFIGLGIGGRIYLHGAALMPEVRWRLTSGTEPSEALRRRLHADDPWRWESPLCTCRSQWDQFANQVEALAADHTPRSKG